MIARKSFIQILLTMSNAVIQWFAIFILARLWGGFAPTAWGIIAFAMAFIGMFSLVSDLGFGSAHVKRVSEGKDIDKCIGTYLYIKLVLTGLLVIIVVGSILTWKYILKNEFYDASKESVIYLFLGYYVLSHLAYVPIYTFRAKKEIAKAEIPFFFGNLLRFSGLIIVAFAGVTGVFLIDEEYTNVDISPKVAWPGFLEEIQIFISNHAIGCMAAAYLFGMLVTFIFLIKLLKRYPISRPDKEYFKSYSTFAIPVMANQSMYFLTTNVDKVMIGFFWSATEVGYYFGAQRIVMLLNAIPLAVSTLVFPTISSMHSKNNLSDIKSLAYKSERYLSMVILPLVVIMVIFPKPIINIVLSSEFYNGWKVLSILALWMWITVLNAPYSNIIKGMNRPGLSAKINITSHLINIILNLLFIPENGLLSSYNINGIEGAAIATIIAVIFRFFAFRIAVKLMIKINFMRKYILIHIIAGFIMGLSLYYLDIAVALTRFYHLIAYSIFGIGIYVIILYILKEFTKYEYDLLMDTLNIREMKNYIFGELRGKNK